MRPHAFRPMMAVAAKSLPHGSEWSYEVKWDGYRAQVVKHGPRVSIASRNLKDITGQFAGITAAAARIRADDAVVDGEIVAIDAHGRPSFQALHHWATEGLSIVFYAFDLLHLDGRDLLRDPLDRRRASLARVIRGSQLLLSEPLPGAPNEIAAAVRRLKLEGVVAKRRRSIYEPGKRSAAWVKVRFVRRQEFIVGGYKPAGDTFDSIVVGYYKERQLMSAGKVRSGFTPHIRADVFARIAPRVIETCPFANLPTTRTGHWGEGITADEMRALRWVEPATVVEVAFTEWTRDGSLRHAAFAGIRDDKVPLDVVREA
jgi:bifunctional non-homologous end joining protein LigD